MTRGHLMAVSPSAGYILIENVHAHTQMYSSVIASVSVSFSLSFMQLICFPELS